MTTTSSRYGRTIYLPPGDDTRSITLRRPPLTPESQGRAYDEAWLRDLLFRNPEVLPIKEIDEGFDPPIPLCRELPTDAGPMDLAYVTESVRLTLVECKLWKNPEARRKVVAQILDYAKEIHGWSYEQLDRAVGRARRARGDSRCLFDLVRDENENIDEAAFVDGVTRNLANGRFLLLVVGDGIREGVKRLAEYLQRLAGVQFTFGLVELAMFELPAASTPGGLIVEPRVLARTVEIERAIVRTQNGVKVEEPPATDAGRPITEDEFYGQLDTDLANSLRKFFGRTEGLGLHVGVEGQALSLLWQRDDGTRVRFGVFYTSGKLNAAYVAQTAHDYGDVKVGLRYLEEVAALIPDAEVEMAVENEKWNWRVIVNGDSPKFAVLLEHTGEWLDAIQRTMDAFNRLTAD